MNSNLDLQLGELPPLEEVQQKLDFYEMMKSMITLGWTFSSSPRDDAHRFVILDPVHEIYYYGETLEIVLTNVRRGLRVSEG